MGPIAPRDERTAHRGLVRLSVPAPPLDQFIEFMVAAIMPRTVTEQVAILRLPDPAAHLIFAIEEGRSLPGGRAIDGNLHAALFLHSAHLRVMPIPPTVRQVVAASLRPHGLRLVVEVHGGELTTSPFVPIEDLWGRPAALLLEELVAAPSIGQRLAILERSLRKRVPRLQLPNAVAIRGTQVISQAHGEIAVDDVASLCGCTTRTLHSAVVAETGLSPKQFARIVRIRRAVELVSAGRPLKDVAVEAAYSDQAHMSREFRSMLLESPSSFRQRLEASNRVPVSYVAETAMTGTGLLMTFKS